MSHIDDIITGIQKIASLGQNPQSNYSIVCTITSIDSDANTCLCTPTDGVTAPIPNVIMVADTSSAVIFMPAVDSQVVVTMLTDSTGYIALNGALSAVALNGTSYGGMIIIQKLVDQMNNIENLLNNLINDYNTHTHVVAGITAGVAAVTSATPIPEETSEIVTKTTVNLLENGTVQHGAGGH